MQNLCFFWETVLFVGRYDQLEIYEEIDDAGRVRPIKICGLCLAENTKVFGTSTTISELSNANSQVQTLEKDGLVSLRRPWAVSSPHYFMRKQCL